MHHVAVPHASLQHLQLLLILESCHARARVRSCCCCRLYHLTHHLLLLLLLLLLLGKETGEVLVTTPRSCQSILAARG
jgi:hypothetical protein